MRARADDLGRHETERLLHVSSFLYYVPDAVLDAAESPVLVAVPPVRVPPIPRRSPFADPGAPIRSMEVDSGSRAPVVPRRPPPASPTICCPSSESLFHRSSVSTSTFDSASCSCRRLAHNTGSCTCSAFGKAVAIWGALPVCARAV